MNQNFCVGNTFAIGVSDIIPIIPLEIRYKTRTIGKNISRLNVPYLHDFYLYLDIYLNVYI